MSEILLMDAYQMDLYVEQVQLLRLARRYDTGCIFHLLPGLAFERIIWLSKPVTFGELIARAKRAER